MDNSNATPKQQLLEKLKTSTNILVTVSANPSVDQLAACLGLTIWLNKVGKHGTAVFSGEVPSTLEFLQPEATLEKNTDSLRDFIIALDKSKADKLRYKVEDTVVKIFITPYRTSLSADDLEFSQGDFNVDMVVAIGVTVQEDLDTAITAHGRILHDATVTTISTNPASQLGSINWSDGQASSLSELIVSLGNELDRTALDGQIATALLTGIVAETDRFSNEKTTPQTMSVSAELMSAGANQQLVASKLDPEPSSGQASQKSSDDTSGESGDQDDESKPPKNDDGTLEIEHSHDDPTAQGETEPAAESSEPNDDPATDDESPAAPNVPVEPPAPEASDEPQLPTDPTPVDQPDENVNSSVVSNKIMTDAPTLGGTLTANSRPDDQAPDPVTDPMSLPTVEPSQPLLDHDNSSPSEAMLDPVMQPAPADWTPPQPSLKPSLSGPLEPPVNPAVPDDTETLTEIEHAVDSPHLEAETPPPLNSARDEVERALNSVPTTNPEPVQALNARPIDLTPPEPFGQSTPLSPAPTPSLAFDPAAFGATDQAETPAPAPDPTAPAAPAPTAEEMSGPINQPFTLPLPPAMSVPPANPNPPTSTVFDPTAPPPVPPPMFPPITRA